MFPRQEHDALEEHLAELLFRCINVMQRLDRDKFVGGGLFSDYLEGSLALGEIGPRWRVIFEPLGGPQVCHAVDLHNTRLHENMMGFPGEIQERIDTTGDESEVSGGPESDIPAFPCRPVADERAWR